MKRLSSLAVICGGLLLAAACGGSNPTAPSPAASARVWRLSGTVRNTSGDTISGATLRIVDGPNATMTTTSAGAGAYSFVGLTESAFTVTTSAPGYVTLSKTVSLTADTSLDIALVRAPAAVLQSVAGSIEGVPQADGTFAFTLPGINTGDGCAGSVTGTSTFVDANNRTITTRDWALGASAIVRPIQTFSYSVTLSSNDALSTRSYTTRFSFVTVTCP